MQIVFEVGDGIASTGNFIAGRVHIDDEASRGNPHQYQHHQADPFLPVVRAVRKRYARSGNNQRIQKLVQWHQTTTPYLFLHTPDIAQAPELVHTLWEDLRKTLPEIGAVPAIPQQSSLF